MLTDAHRAPVIDHLPSSPVTVQHADSAEALLREGAVLFDVERGQITWQDRQYRLADLLVGANLIITYGAPAGCRAGLTQLLESWGIPTWDLAHAEAQALRDRLPAAQTVRES